MTKPKHRSFSYAFTAPDSRPRVTGCGYSGKGAYIVVEACGQAMAHQCSKALVSKLMKLPAQSRYAD